FDYTDVIEFMMVGASAVGIGTVNLVDHDAGAKIITGLQGYLKEKNAGSIKSFIGRLKI
ncbi:unnamed protein product, partial [marine sediment metagenome]